MQKMDTPEKTYTPEKTCLLGFHKVRFQPACLATEICLKIEILLLASLDMILFNKRITRVLIWLGGCAGLHLCCSQIPKTGFLTSRLILHCPWAGCSKSTYFRPMEFSIKQLSHLLYSKIYCTCILMSNENAPLFRCAYLWPIKSCAKLCYL